MHPPELSGHASPETLKPTITVLDCDTNAGGWRKTYRRLVEKSGGLYTGIDSYEELQRNLDMISSASAQTALIILSGQQLLDGWQTSWLELITNRGYRNMVVIVTGFPENSSEWIELKRRFDLPMIEKYYETFKSNFHELLVSAATDNTEIE